MFCMFDDIKIIYVALSLCIIDFFFLNFSEENTLYDAEGHEAQSNQILTVHR